MTTTDQLREIARELRKIKQFSPAAAEAVDDWRRNKRRVLEELGSRYPDVELPAQVWHYLDDAEERIKYPMYRLMQNEMLDGIIADLERGHVPESGGAGLPFHPFWLLGALALLLGTYLILRF